MRFLPVVAEKRMKQFWFRPQVVEISQGLAMESFLNKLRKMILSPENIFLYNILLSPIVALRTLFGFVNCLSRDFKSRSTADSVKSLSVGPIVSTRCNRE